MNSVLTSRAEIAAALKMSDPIIAGSAIALSQHLMAHPNVARDGHVPVPLVCRCIRTVAREFDLPVDNPTSQLIAERWHPQILFLALSIVAWSHTNEARLNTALKWAGRAALVGIGAAFGLGLG